jgi:protoporphyrinogen oxidase
MLDPPAPPEVLQAAHDLKHKAIIFVYLMLDREQVTPDHWVYLPEKHLTIHRISEFKNFSDTMCPPGKTLVCAEITCSEGDARWRQTDAELVDIATRDLTTVGFLKKEEVVGSTIRRVPYAYPLYDLPYRKNLQTMLVYLRRFKNLISTGRQGLFRYGNMDHSIAMGARVAKTLATGQGPDHGEVATEDESFD